MSARIPAQRVNGQLNYLQPCHVSRKWAADAISVILKLFLMNENGKEEKSTLVLTSSSFLQLFFPKTLIWLPILTRSTVSTDPIRQSVIFGSSSTGRETSFRSATPICVVLSKEKMSAAELKDRLSVAFNKVNDLGEQLQQRRLQLLDTDVARYSAAQGKTPVNFQPNDLVCCRILQGHTGKVYSLDWTPDRNRIVSASQDGRLIVWNALTSQKTHAIKLPCAWVMTCSFSYSGQSVASGGLDSVCSVFNLSSPTDKDGNLPVSKTLIGHKGYVSCCQYLPDDDTRLITSSGDKTCILWDITTGLKTSVFGGEFQSGHTADVLSVSVCGSDSRMFISGSCDKTARLWDTRVASRAVRTFYGHEGDVNTVKFFPDGNRFGTGSDDGMCRLFDIRTGHNIQVYRHGETDLVSTVTSLAFSISGRLMFSSYSNGDCYIWDTLLAQVVQDLGSLQNSHEGRISCLGLSPDGSALCTGSWDKNLKIWAFGGSRRVI